MATRTRALAFALAVTTPLALATSCSDDSEEERAAAALQAEMVANAGMTSRQPVDASRTGCVADGMVRQLGVGTLQRYRLLTDDLRADESIEGVQMSAEDADALAGVFAECMDVERMMERQIISGLDLPPRQRRKAVRCVRDRVGADQVVRIMAAEFQGTANPVFQRLQDDLRACLR
jgi:hypothetical protein